MALYVSLICWRSAMSCTVESQATHRSLGHPVILLKIRVHCRAVRIFYEWQLGAAWNQDLLGKFMRNAEGRCRRVGWGVANLGHVYENEVSLCLINVQAQQFICKSYLLEIVTASWCWRRQRKAATATAEDVATDCTSFWTWFWFMVFLIWYWAAVLYFTQGV